jgi:general transcription factor 3C polypeptide 3 (transcription factor C subunit 4)
LQGQSFLTKYAEVEGGTQGGLGSTESNYNLGRLFQLLGISYLAIEYYSKALRAFEDTSDNENVARMAMVNYVNLLILLKHERLALALTRQNIVL